MARSERWRAGLHQSTAAAAVRAAASLLFHGAIRARRPPISAGRTDGTPPVVRWRTSAAPYSAGRAGHSVMQRAQPGPGASARWAAASPRLGGRVWASETQMADYHSRVLCACRDETGTVDGRAPARWRPHARVTWVAPRMGIPLPMVIPAGGACPTLTGVGFVKRGFGVGFMMLLVE